MRRATLGVILVAAGVGGTALGCRPSDRREVRDYERMRRQQRYDLYDTSRFFANGATMQAPPAHTVSRDLTLAAHGQVASLAYLTGRDRGAFVTDLPAPGDSATLAVGGRQFAISCAPCHGAGGFGGGPIAPNLVGRRPASLRAAPADTLSPGALFSIVTDGFGNMPPYGWQLDPAARWAVIAYVRSLSTAQSTAATRADSAAAAHLHLLDSLHAAHASVAAVMQVEAKTP
jgi:mono/diheme cytochrome c family protein